MLDSTRLDGFFSRTSRGPHGIRTKAPFVAVALLGLGLVLLQGCSSSSSAADDPCPNAKTTVDAFCTQVIDALSDKCGASPPPNCDVVRNTCKNLANVCKEDADKVSASLAGAADCDAAKAIPINTRCTY